ncbi:Pleiotropic drug resistance protein 12 [Phytophthora cinnamomi]|uniref:Pleiotropic drug resistance protein 12 n=1 Tax=Phytophthora cinnamomi TaxID=4785 RepID=UPI00355A4E12|nr:Pleiotropic drug resistance protein 12 [Phytophthora cinnamomi]
MARPARSSASFLRRWRRLLGAEPALSAVVDCLSPREAVCVLVFALDAQYEPLARFLYAHARLLALGDAARRFSSVLHCAAAHGCAEVVQWLLRFRLSHRALLGAETSVRNAPWTPPSPSSRAKALAWSARNSAYEFPAEVMYEAARQGDQEVVQWLSCCCRFDRHRAMEYAASAGRLEVATWLHAQQEGQEETAVVVYMVQPLESELQVLNWVAVFPRRRCFREVFASRAGLLADVYDQRDPLLPWDDAEALGTSLGRRRFRALDTAAAQGDLAMVKRLHEDGRWPCTSLAMDTAAANGHLEVVKFLHENRREGGTAVGMCSAAGNGHLDVVQWLHKNRSSDGCRSLVLDLAATNGHVEVLRWLAPRFPRFSCSPAFLPSVAAHGHIKTLQYLHKEMRMPLDSRTLEAAIGSGHLELVNYITERIPAEKRHTLSPTAVEKAAASGNLELLAFVVERLGLWSPQVLIAAAPTGNVEMAEWITKRTDSPPEEAPQVVLVRERRDRAATSNAIDSMLPSQPASSIKRRSSFDNLSSIGCARPLDVVDGGTLYRCASLRHFNMIEWLLKRGLASPGFSLSMKERELVLRSVVGRGVVEEDSLDVVALTGNSDANGATTEPPTAAVTAATTAVIGTANGNDNASGANAGVARLAGVRTTTEDKRPGFDPFAWALPAKTSPYWQRKFVRLAVQYCPESSLKLEWVPLWAAQRGELDVLKQLYTVKHPQLFTQQTFSAIMRYTKAGDALQWFQTHSSTLMGDSSIVEWGVKYRQFAYLTYVFLKFQPARAEERFRQHGVEYALHVACAMGHLDVVTWICGNCEIFLNVPASELHAKLGRLTIWNDALIAAARCGQIGILVWLHEKFTFFRKVPDSHRKMTLVAAMADAAAGYGQLCVLRWLQATVAPQLVYSNVEPKPGSKSTPPPIVETSFVSTEGLLQAMVNRHVDVVQWVCAVDMDLVSRQTANRRAELATFLREEADGFVPSKLGFIFPPL